MASVSAVGVLITCGVASAGAAVTVGQTFTPTNEWGGAGVFIQSASPGNSYTVPSNGVITSWSFEATNASPSPPLKLKIVRRVGGDDFLTVGDSQLETPTQGVLNTWSTRVPAQAGDLLSLYFTDDIFSYRSGVTPDYVTNEISGDPGDPAVDPPPGTTVTYEGDSPNKQIDAAAVLELDEDHDAFGDESQDKCLGTPGNYSGCPSAFQLNSVKQKRGAKKIRVNLSVPGAGTVAVGSPGDPALASTSKKSVKAKTTTETTTGKHGVSFTLKLTKGAAGKLARSGAIKIKVQAVYTPPGGPPASIVAKRKLKS
jgi:hypothetical protein